MDKNIKLREAAKDYASCGLNLSIDSLGPIAERVHDAFLDGANFQKNNSWVSVEEQLPDYNVDVLVRGSRKQNKPQMEGNPPVTIISKRMPRMNAMMDRYQDKNDFMYMEEVTHWQPLPDIPI